MDSKDWDALEWAADEAVAMTGAPSAVIVQTVIRIARKRRVAQEAADERRLDALTDELNPFGQEGG